MWPLTIIILLSFGNLMDKKNCFFYNLDVTNICSALKNIRVDANNTFLGQKL